MKHSIRFVPSGRGKAQCAPDPNYPAGIVINAAPGGVKSCTVDLPYPAPECGWFEIDCRECGCSLLISAAGRPDDPKQVTFACEKEKL